MRLTRAVPHFVKRHLVGTVVGLALLGGVAGVAVGQVGGNPRHDAVDSGARPEDPERGVRGVGLPKGPFVDFCPTTQQGELHLQVYGFDYKPTVACTREGKAPRPTPGQLADTANDPDEGLSEQARCEYHKRLLERAKPLPGEVGGHTLRGVLPNGDKVEVRVFGTKPIESFEEEARMTQC